MQEEQISSPNFGSLVARHRAYFMSGKTRSPEWREEQLKALSAMITEGLHERTRCLYRSTGVDGEIRYPPYPSRPTA